MKQNLRLLDQVQIAKPCPASWDEMTGDERVRHCSLCRLNVYNVAEMTRDDAERLLRENEGKRVCIQLFRREDGTVITRDCPKGLKAFKQRAVKRLALAAAFVLSTVGCGQTAERLKADFGIKPTSATLPTSAIRGRVAIGFVIKPAPAATTAKPAPTQKP